MPSPFEAYPEGRRGFVLPMEQPGEITTPKRFVDYFHRVWSMNAGLYMPATAEEYSRRSVDRKHIVVPQSDTQPMVYLDYVCEPGGGYGSAKETMRVMTPPEVTGDFVPVVDISYRTPTPRLPGATGILDVLYEDEHGSWEVPQEEIDYSPETQAQHAMLGIVATRFVELTRA